MGHPLEVTYAGTSETAAAWVMFGERVVASFYVAQGATTRITVPPGELVVHAATSRGMQGPGPDTIEREQPVTLAAGESRTVAFDM